MARVKAEYFNAKDKATGEIKEVQFIPPEPSGGDLGGISQEKLEQIDKLKEDLVYLADKRENELLRRSNNDLNYLYTAVTNIEVDGNTIKGKALNTYSCLSNVWVKTSNNYYCCKLTITNNGTASIDNIRLLQVFSSSVNIGIGKNGTIILSGISLEAGQSVTKLVTFKSDENDYTYMGVGVMFGSEDVELSITYDCVYDITSLSKYVDIEKFITNNGIIANFPIDLLPIENNIDELNKRIDELDTWYVGKKWCNFGDSNTDMGRYQSTVVSKLKLSVSYKRGVGGSSVASNGIDAFWKDARINKLDADSDFITIMGGTNDSANNRTVGDITFDNHNTSTFVGAYNVMLSKIYRRFLGIDGYYSDIDYSGVTVINNPAEFIPIFLCTPPSSVSEQYKNNGKLVDIVNAVKEIGKMWGLPVIDVFSECQINELNCSQLLQSDGVHWTVKGGTIGGNCIANGLKRYEPIN